jgi:hypothetical protein
LVLLWEEFAFWLNPRLQGSAGLGRATASVRSIQAGALARREPLSPAPCRMGSIDVYGPLGVQSDKPTEAAIAFAFSKAFGQRQSGHSLGRDLGPERFDCGHLRAG